MLVVVAAGFAIRIYSDYRQGQAQQAAEQRAWDEAQKQSDALMHEIDRVEKQLERASAPAHAHEKTGKAPASAAGKP